MTEPWWLSSHWSGNKVVNVLQHTTLALTWSDGQSGRPEPINRLVMSSPICFIPTVLLNLHLQQVPNTYLLGARRQWLRVNCVERRGIWLVLRTWNWLWLRSLLSTRVSLSQPRRTQGGFRIGWWSAGSVKNIQHIWRLQIKKSKRNLSESDSENKAADFPRFIVIESLEEVCEAKFSPFLIEKEISTRASLKTVKKTRNGNLLVEVDSRRPTENILKIKTFHTTKRRAYLHKKLNTFKEVIRSRELALATELEIASALGKQGVTNIKRISIRKGKQRILTNTYILTFKQPRIPKEVKTGDCLERVEPWPSLIPRPARWNVTSR